MTCKDCIHYDVCVIVEHQLREDEDYLTEFGCSDFKPKSRYIELPCAVGDTMYKLCSVNSNIKIGQFWDGIKVENNCDRCGYRNCSCYDIGLRERDKPYFIDVIEEKTIKSVEFLVRIKPYVGTIWFNTKEEAEKALAERNAGNG